MVGGNLSRGTNQRNVIADCLPILPIFQQKTIDVNEEPLLAWWLHYPPTHSTNQACFVFCTSVHEILLPSDGLLARCFYCRYHVASGISRLCACCSKNGGYSDHQGRSRRSADTDSDSARFLLGRSVHEQHDRRRRVQDRCRHLSRKDRTGARDGQGRRQGYVRAWLSILDARESSIFLLCYVLFSTATKYSSLTICILILLMHRSCHHFSDNF